MILKLINKRLNLTMIRLFNARKILALILCACLFNLSTMCMAHALGGSTQSTHAQLPCHVAKAEQSKPLNAHNQHDRTILQSDLLQSTDQAISAHDAPAHHQCAMACNLSSLNTSQTYNLEKFTFTLSVQSDALIDNQPRQAFLRQLDRPPQLFL